jgi:bacterial/archaeal transporter family protein
MHWLVWALLAAAFFGAYNFFIKVSSGHIHEVAGAVILQVVAAVLGLILLLYLKWRGVVLDISPKGVSFAVLAGVAVGLSEITSFYLFSRGVSVSSGLPVVLGGSVIVGTALGMLFLRETINPLQVLAIGMIVAGVAILAAR